MATVTFVQSDGSRVVVACVPGESVMRLALVHDVPGIIAECGGHMICGTCHVLLEATDVAWFKPPGGLELSLLEDSPGRGTTSRLSCQLKCSEHLGDVTVHVPGEQPT